MSLAKRDNRFFVANALAASGLVIIDDCAIDFYLNLVDQNLCNYIDLRKQGEALNKNEKKMLGIKSRAIISKEYWSFLNEEGRHDPIHSALVISAFISKYLFHVKKINNVIRNLGVKSRVRLIPSNMLAGPCDACLQYSKYDFEAIKVLLPPFAECPHPDQCACMFTVSSW